MSAKHLELGKNGEELAIAYFLERGYTLVATNWRAGKYEIDLIVRDKKQLVVVEVKTRTSNALAEPETAVTREKQRMLIQAADIYVQRYRIPLEVRFDIVSVIIAGSRHRVKHITDAFYPTLYR